MNRPTQAGLRTRLADLIARQDAVSTMPLASREDRLARVEARATLHTDFADLYQAEAARHDADSVAQAALVEAAGSRRSRATQAVEDLQDMRDRLAEDGPR